MTKALEDKLKNIVEGYYKLYPFEYYIDGDNIFCTRSGIKFERIDNIYDVKVLDNHGFYRSIANGFILDLIYDSIIAEVLSPKKRIIGKI